MTISTEPYSPVFTARIEYDPRDFHRGASSNAAIVVAEGSANMVVLMITFADSWLADNARFGITALTRTPSDKFVFPTPINLFNATFNPHTKTTSVFGAIVLP